ncbi:MAG: type II toxin-antitoxin system RelE/ParE family toxin [Patescibacteria group bacterium]
MEFRSTPLFDKNLSKKLKKNPQLREKIKKQVDFLKTNFRHPSLKLHKLTGNRSEEYSIWIEGNLRITFKFKGNVVLFTDLVTHDQY